MLTAAGGIVSSVPSDEIYAAMQTGSLDAAITSSTSLISFRLNEIAKNVTSVRGGSFWFVLEPLIISKAIYDALTAGRQKVVTEIGRSLEAFGLAQAKADDDVLAAICAKAGVKVQDFSTNALTKWRVVADLLSAVFCGYFTFKCSQMLHETWTEGHTTPSSWGAPLFVPYSCMTLGMGLLKLQLAVQVFGKRS